MTFNKMKLNCDVGEGQSSDKDVIPFVGQVNIACGLHAGDVELMVETIKFAQLNHVQIGAHPSYDDRENFGRVAVSLTPEQIKNLIIYQVAALQALAKQHQARVEYVKPHGALYNEMMANEQAFTAIVEAISSFDEPLMLMILARPDLSRYQSIAHANGVSLILEAFADRGYDDAGYLIKRTESGALLATAELVEKQVKQLVETSTITTNTGRVINLQVDSICVHGDNPVAVKLIEKLAKLIV